MSAVIISSVANMTISDFLAPSVRMVYLRLMENIGCNITKAILLISESEEYVLLGHFEQFSNFDQLFFFFFSSIKDMNEF